MRATEDTAPPPLVRAIHADHGYRTNLTGPAAPHGNPTAPDPHRTPRH
jgi:hypothetical protein